MQCTHIRVENFRNIKEADVSFTDGVNLLVGCVVRYAWRH